jgi:hypothetical protein
VTEKVVLVQLEPARNASSIDCFQGLSDTLDLSTLLAHFDTIVRSDLVGRNVHDPSVYLEMTVSDELPGFSPRACKTQTIDHVVQARLQQKEQVFACNALFSKSRLEVDSKLFFKDAVNPLDFLLFPELGSIVREFPPKVSVLPGRIAPSLDGTLVGVASLTLEEQLGVVPSAESANGFRITRQKISLLWVHTVAPIRPFVVSEADIRCEVWG